MVSRIPIMPNLQCCCSTGSRDWLRSNICAVFRRKHFLDTEVSVLNSFLHPEVPRVNVLRSLSFSQSILQRMRRRTVTLYFGLHWNSQILIHRSQGYYSARNKFERFRGFLELVSRFEFEFCRRVNYFLKDSNFWCVHVNVPWPLCTHAIPFRMLWLP